MHPPLLGFLFALLAYGLWGLLPVYWRGLHEIHPATILAFRIAMSCLFLAFIIGMRGRWQSVQVLLRDRRGMAMLALSSLLIAGNWLLYIGGVNSGRVIECSLGYFIMPLVNVLVAVLFLHERVRSLQAIAIGIAAIGVGLRTWEVGSLPLLSLGLAFTFAGYGILRRATKVDSLTGLGFETVLLTPFALLFLTLPMGFQTMPDRALSFSEIALLLGAGIATSIPLMAYVEAAKRLSLTSLGVLQFISPSIQFLSAVFFFGESINPDQWFAFIIIWTGLLLFSVDKVREGMAHFQRVPGDTKT